jgi:hypothetical protein
MMSATAQATPSLTPIVLTMDDEIVTSPTLGGGTQRL